MSTYQTPALARATEALSTHGERVASGSERGTPSAYARAVVSAALHDPDDPDWLPDVIAAAIRDFHADPTIPHFARHVADTVRTKILGEGS